MFDPVVYSELVVGHILKYPSCLGLIEWFARYIKSCPNHFRDARCFKNIYMLKCSEQIYIILNISYFPKQLPCNAWNMNPYLTISQSAKFWKRVNGEIRFLVNQRSNDDANLIVRRRIMILIDLALSVRDVLCFRMEKISTFFYVSFKVLPHCSRTCHR